MTQILDLLLLPPEYAGVDEFNVLELQLGGGTPSTLNALGGSVTPTGTLNRKAKITLGGSVTPVGGLSTGSGTIVQASQGGAVTSSGTVNDVSIYGDFLQGSVTPSGVVTTRVISGAGFTNAVGGSCTPIGALTLKVKKTLSGVVQPTGTLIRKPQITLGGSVTPSGTAASISSNPGAGFTITVGGSVTPSGGTVGFKIKVAMGGSLTPSGALNVKVKALVMGGSVTPTGAVTTYQAPPAPVISSIAQISFPSGND